MQDVISIWSLTGERPSCEETYERVYNDTVARHNAGTLLTCSVNDVPGTFNYYGVCSTASCIPLDYCLLPEW